MRGPVEQAGGNGVARHCPAAVAQVVERMSLPQPDPEQHPLGASLPVVEDLARLRRRAPVGEARRVGGRVADVPPPGAADVAVRAGADAPPVVAQPVALVVPGALRARRGPVAHLVPLHPRRGQHLVGEQVAVGEVVVVGRRDLAAADLHGEAGALLDDEGVRAQVVRLARQGGLETCPPVRLRLPRGAVDEVQADAVEAGLARPLHDARHPLRVVRAVEGGQDVRHR